MLYELDLHYPPSGGRAVIELLVILDLMSLSLWESRAVSSERVLPFALPGLTARPSRSSREGDVLRKSHDLPRGEVKMCSALT